MIHPGIYSIAMFDIAAFTSYPGLAITLFMIAHFMISGLTVDASVVSTALFRGNYPLMAITAAIAGYYYAYAYGTPPTMLDGLGRKSVVGWDSLLRTIGALVLLCGSPFLLEAVTTPLLGALIILVHAVAIAAVAWMFRDHVVMGDVRGGGDANYKKLLRGVAVYNFANLLIAAPIIPMPASVDVVWLATYISIGTFVVMFVLLNGGVLRTPLRQSAGKK